MLRKHSEFLQREFPSVSSKVIHNYQEVIFGEGEVKIETHEPKEPRLIHGRGLEIEKTQISQRRKMATQGAVFISYHRSSGRLEITSAGLPLMAQEHLESLKKKLLRQIQSDLANREEGYFKDQLKISSRQFFNVLVGYKPVTEVHLY
jgi:mRNA degradation ribonuclease J1/J2